MHLMRTFSSLALVASAALLLAAGWGGAAAANPAAQCNARVHASSDANGVLWMQGGSNPVVYALAGTRVISPAGASRIPAGATGVGFWVCHPYSLLYVNRKNVLRMRGTHGTTTIGANAVAAPSGGFLTFDGKTIRYTNGEELFLRGMDPDSHITTVAADPRNRHIVFVSTEQKITEECKLGQGVAYRVTPVSTTQVLDWIPCHGNPLVGWSPDGTHMSFIQGSRHILYIADAFGRTPVGLAPEVSSYLWSPNGSRIAYNVFRARKPHVAVVDVATGVTRVVAAGTLGAWSPDGKEIAVMSGSSLMGVPAAGGVPHKLASLS
jgi:hypothetical protein